MPLPGFPAGWGLSVHLKAVPVVDEADALSLFPAWFRDSDSPARDAIATGLVEQAAKHASRLAAYAAQANEQYATGSWLDLVGGSCVRALGESDVAYRARVLNSDRGVTVAGLMASINEILARVTPGKTAYYLESPHDDPRVYSSSDARAFGWYVGATYEVVSPTGRYGHHALVRTIRRGTPEAQRSIPAVPSLLDTTVVRYLDGGDTTDGPVCTDSDNTLGHATVHIPALPAPGTSLLGDLRIVDLPATLTNPDGTLTDEAQAAATMATTLRTEAQEEATLALLGELRGGSAYSADDERESAVAQIQALLARAALGARFSIVLDPTI